MSYVSEAQQLQADTEMKLTALYNRYSDLTALNSALLYGERLLHLIGIYICIYPAVFVRKTDICRT